VFSSRECGCITSPVSEDALQCEKRISLSQSHVVNMSKNDAYVDFQVGIYMCALKYVAMCCRMLLQCVAACCSVLQCVAVCCSVVNASKHDAYFEF